MGKLFTNLKKRVAILTVLCMMLTLAPSPAFATTVSDISGHWAQTTIQSWVDNGLIKGYPDGTFKPDNNITRAEFITLVNRAFEYTNTAPISFTDVNQNAWYASAIGVAVEAGYISGYPDGTMKPENPISRVEAATIIMKINKLEANLSAANTFTDAASLTWSKGAVGAVFAAGLMIGYPDGSFGPQKLIKRGEATVALDRAMKATSLTEDELAYFSDDSFFNGEYLNIRNQFLSSLYDNPSDIDLFGLFYCGSGIDETITEDELKAVMAKSGIEGSIENLPFPCEKISRASIDEILTKYMDLTLADTSKIGLENFVYLQKYDAYYFFHGDTNYRGNIKFSSGERKGDVVRLFYDDVFFSDGLKVLTLQEKNGEYLFIANQRFDSETGKSVEPSTSPDFTREYQEIYHVMEKTEEAYAWFNGYGEIERDANSKKYFDNDIVWYGIVAHEGISTMEGLEVYLLELFDDETSQNLISTRIDGAENMPLFRERNGILYCAAGVVGQIHYSDCDWTLGIKTIDEESTTVVVNWDMSVWDVPLNGSYEMNCVRGDDGIWRFTDFVLPLEAAVAAYDEESNE